MQNNSHVQYVFVGSMAASVSLEQSQITRSYTSIMRSRSRFAITTDPFDVFWKLSNVEFLKVSNESTHAFSELFVEFLALGDLVAGALSMRRNMPAPANEYTHSMENSPRREVTIFHTILPALTISDVPNVIWVSSGSAFGRSSIHRLFRFCVWSGKGATAAASIFC